LNVLARLLGLDDTLRILARDYPGDEAWEKFADACGASSDDIRAVADAVCGGGGAGWFESKVPALGHRRPSAVLQGHPRGLAIVRHVLMRVP
jgi:hypothetical protein